MADGGFQTHFDRAQYLTGSGRLQAGRRSCALALLEDPSDHRSIALMARIESLVDKSATAEASATVDGLILDHPDDVYLQVVAAILRDQRGDHSGAISELRLLAEQTEGDLYVHQSLGLLLSTNPETKQEAWSHYLAAIKIGPLLAPSYKASAYSLGKQFDSSRVSEIFEGAGFFERLAVRTRALDFKFLFSVFAVPTVAAFFLCLSGHVSLGYGLTGMASAWALWCVFINFVTGCQKCALGWLLCIPYLWLFAVVGAFDHSDHLWINYVLVGSILAPAPFLPGKRATETAMRERGQLVRLYLKRLLVPGAISTVLLLAVVSPHHPAKMTQGSAANCAGPAVLGQGVSSQGQHELVVAAFHPGTSRTQALHFAQFTLGYAADNCYALTELDSDTNGTEVLHVLGSATQARLDRHFLISYLEQSGLFSFVLPGKGVAS